MLFVSFPLPGNLPTTHRICEEDITIIVLEQNQYRTQQTVAFEPGMSTPWQQYRADGQPRAVAVCCVVALYSRQSKETWICDITSLNANELVVVSFKLIICSHGSGRTFNRLKNLTGHFVHTGPFFKFSLFSHETLNGYASKFSYG